MAEEGQGQEIGALKYSGAFILVHFGDIYIYIYDGNNTLKDLLIFDPSNIY
jgi:hypothetical protein